ncbi:MAG: type II toxin-antitoxin system VapC family toxin [Acetobacteraceae bacterium]
MFVLDTNVLSAMMSAKPAQEVAAWLLDRPSEELFTAAVCQAEILAGIAVLPAGRRHSELAAAARAMFIDEFDGRVLPFDMDAAAAYAELFTARRKAGRPTATIDLMIAAVARARGASLVTRNVADFQECGLSVINPWGG